MTGLGGEGSRISLGGAVWAHNADIDWDPYIINGDVVTADQLASDEYRGALEVITRDGREYLIPNEDFVTQRVENWSFESTLVRVVSTLVVPDRGSVEVFGVGAHRAVGGIRVQHD